MNLRHVQIWLLALCLATAAITLIGGATRLNNAGLAITEWEPVTGILPPLSDSQWEAAFNKYKAIPQYRELNPDMTLNQFKTIYWWEWGHRIAARALAVLFLPFFWFLARGQLPTPLALRLTVIFLLGAAQALLGWWMVQSGLTQRVDVSHYRLAAHLALALVIYALLLQAALDPLNKKLPSPAAWGLTALLFVQIVSGAFVSGLDAGKIYTDWPLMGGAWFPADAFPSPDNPAFIQLLHRFGAYAFLLAALLRCLTAPPYARNSALAVLAAALAQSVLGIAALLSAAPTGLALLHQAGMLVLWTAALAHLKLSAPSGQNPPQKLPRLAPL